MCTPTTQSLGSSSHHDREQSIRTKRSSIREIMDTTNDNFLKRRLSRSQQMLNQGKKSSKQHGETEKGQRIERRASVQKSLDTFDEEDDILKTIITDGNVSNNNKSKSRYLRRGSVTKHQIDPKVNEMQPNCRATRSENEDMEYEDPSGASDAAKKRRYLRRGSVTKYVLDAAVDDLQPTKILEDSHNRPRRQLPPPPMKNSKRNLMKNEEPVVIKEECDLPMKPTSRRDRESKTKTSKTTKKRKRSVSFGIITFYEFPLVLGHHPSVSSGAPTMLGNECQDINEIDVSIFEKYYRSQHRRRRGRKLALSVPERARRLMEAGYTIKQIGKATQAVQVIKKERADTIHSFIGRQKWDRFHIFLESASRALRTMVEVPPALIGARTA
jgi:hypothetical protein